MSKHFQRIMIFGRPGSGKSTFALWVSRVLMLPLHHLDKHFFIENWVERDHNEFLQIQDTIVNNKHWIVDGNSIRSLEMRWRKADLVLYFDYPRLICYFRILRRFLKPEPNIDDRAAGCEEAIRWSLLKYVWNFSKRVESQISLFKERYPNTVFREIKNDKDLQAFKYVLTATKCAK
jgi:adenylate kinase family enzyme